MKSFLVATATAVLGAFVAGAVGCGSPFSAASPGTDGGTQSDVTAQDAFTQDGAADGSTAGDGSAADASTSSIVYVAYNGKDTNSGLDPADPVKTIGQGLLVAAKLSGVPTVEVCGSASNPYTEGLLEIGKDLVLQGGWDCAFQTRNPKANPTVVNNNGAALSGGSR